MSARRAVVHLAAYVWALATAAYFVGFISNRYTPSTVDSGVQAPTLEALLTDIGLLALFTVPHSLLARRWWKAWRWHKTAYLVVTAGTLTLLFARWEPLPRLVWKLEGAWWLNWVGVAGWLLALYAAAVMNHAYTFGWTTRSPAFHTPGPYGRVRHPQMLGILIGVWSTPEMSEGRLLVAAFLTVYILVAVRWEERDLEAAHGAAYREYRKRAGMLFPR